MIWQWQILLGSILTYETVYGGAGKLENAQRILSITHEKQRSCQPSALPPALDGYLVVSYGQSFVQVILRCILCGVLMFAVGQLHCCVDEAPRSMAGATCCASKEYDHAFNKYLTASCAPSPLRTFIPAYVRTIAYTGCSDINDGVLIGYEKVPQADTWMLNGWVLIDVDQHDNGVMEYQHIESTNKVHQLPRHMRVTLLKNSQHTTV
ncbi:hypothetical protein EV424DRAFT_300668 [Suillus variegatus]|nr:hypothetical protein EV424DRAFT_300668 [Suillus variegatus]